MALVHCMLLAGESALETLASNEDVLHLAKVFLAPDCLLCFGEMSHVAGSMSAMSLKGAECQLE